MKRLYVAILVLSLFLASCASGPVSLSNSQPAAQENADWKVQVTGLKTSTEPLPCTACKSGGTLTLTSDYKFLVVETTLVNKGKSPAALEPLKVGILLNTTLQDCGFRTDANSNCLPSAIAYAGKTYAYMNSDLGATIDFLSNIQVAANAPGGEAVVFYYVVKSGAKATGFVFNDLPKIDIQNLNP